MCQGYVSVSYPCCVNVSLLGSVSKLHRCPVAAVDIVSSLSVSPSRCRGVCCWCQRLCCVIVSATATTSKVPTAATNHAHLPPSARPPNNTGTPTTSNRRKGKRQRNVGPSKRPSLCSTIQAFRNLRRAKQSLTCRRLLSLRCAVVLWSCGECLVNERNGTGLW